MNRTGIAGDSRETVDGDRASMCAIARTPCPPCMQERELISLESDNSGPAAIWILRRGRGDCERLILPPCTRAALGSGVRWWRAEPKRGARPVTPSTATMTTGHGELMPSQPALPRRWRMEISIVTGRSEARPQSEGLLSGPGHGPGEWVRLELDSAPLAKWLVAAL